MNCTSQVVDLEKHNNAFKERLKQVAGDQSWAASYEDGAQFMSDQARHSLQQFTNEIWRIGRAFLNQIARSSGKENSVAEVTFLLSNQFFKLSLKSLFGC